MHVVTTAASAINQSLLPLFDDTAPLIDLPVAIPPPAHPRRRGCSPPDPYHPAEFDHIRDHGTAEVVRARQEAGVHHLTTDNRELTDSFIN